MTFDDFATMNTLLSVKPCPPLYRLESDEHPFRRIEKQPDADHARRE